MKKKKLIYQYEMWNKEEFIGYFNCKNALEREKIVIPENKVLGLKQIRVPFRYIYLYTDGIDYTYRLILDVSRISKKQINYLRSLNEFSE